MIWIWSMTILTNGKLPKTTSNNFYFTLLYFNNVICIYYMHMLYTEYPRTHLKPKRVLIITTIKKIEKNDLTWFEVMGF